MKRIVSLLLVLMLLPAFASAAPSVLPGDLLCVLTARPLYDSYDYYTRRIIAYVPDGGVVMYIAGISWGYCVAYGNYAGYITSDNLYKVGSYTGINFELPDGSDYSGYYYDDYYDPGSDYVPTDGKTYVPEFPYSQRYCKAIMDFSTRTGPGTRFTEAGGFSMNLTYRVYYQATSSVPWGYYEFTSGGKRYRLYTGMKRISDYGYVPYDSDTYVWAQITSGHTPSYGPGTDYAKAKYYVPGGITVQAYYQENGWLMFDYETETGLVQRAWAPPSAWK
ncbi:MAG: hypothetical protein IKR85_05900 [Clostridia bacterium]|nr:hypothetical protein [Clostridia bacterium]